MPNYSSIRYHLKLWHNLQKYVTLSKLQYDQIVHHYVNENTRLYSTRTLYNVYLSSIPARVSSVRNLSRAPSASEAHTCTSMRGARWPASKMGIAGCSRCALCEGCRRSPTGSIRRCGTSNGASHDLCRSRVPRALAAPTASARVDLLSPTPIRGMSGAVIPRKFPRKLGQSAEGQSLHTMQHK